MERLRSRYAQLAARIKEKTTEPARRDELLASAERLNPDRWQTPDDVTRGLEEYETVFASLGALVGHKRRRRRRGRRSGTPRTDTPATTTAADANTDPAATQPAETPDSDASDEDDVAEPEDDGPDGESGSGNL